MRRRVDGIEARIALCGAPRRAGGDGCPGDRASFLVGGQTFQDLMVGLGVDVSAQRIDVPGLRRSRVLARERAARDRPLDRAGDAHRAAARAPAPRRGRRGPAHRRGRLRQPAVAPGPRRDRDPRRFVQPDGRVAPGATAHPRPVHRGCGARAADAAHQSPGLPGGDARRGRAPPSHAAFESLLEETERLVRLSRSLDTLADGDAGRPMRSISIDLGALIGSAVELAEPQMRSRGVRLELRLPTPETRPGRPRRAAPGHGQPAPERRALHADWWPGGGLGRPDAIDGHRAPRSRSATPARASPPRTCRMSSSGSTGWTSRARRRAVARASAWPSCGCWSRRAAARWASSPPMA